MLGSLRRLGTRVLLRGHLCDDHHDRRKAR